MLKFMKRITHAKILHQSLTVQALTQRRQIREIYDLLKAGECGKAQSKAAQALLIKRVNLRDASLVENKGFHK